MASIEYTRTVIRDTVRSAVQYGWSLARACSEIYPTGANTLDLQYYQTLGRIPGYQSFHEYQYQFI